MPLNDSLLFVWQLGNLLYKTLFEEAEELRGMFFNLTQV
jgi:hypothetical protein